VSAKGGLSQHATDYYDERVTERYDEATSELAEPAGV
jgi:hypothetical protein